MRDFLTWYLPIWIIRAGVAFLAIDFVAGDVLDLI